MWGFRSVLRVLRLREKWIGLLAYAVRVVAAQERRLTKFITHNVPEQRLEHPAIQVRDQH
eukprot:COSAG02_NODE_3806_length_6203_cov_175.828637_6_plen_59_part_01